MRNEQHLADDLKGQGGEYLYMEVESIKQCVLPYPTSHSHEITGVFVYKLL